MSICYGNPKSPRFPSLGGLASGFLTRWSESLEDPPREITLYSSRLSSSLLKEVMAKEGGGVNP